MPTTDRISNALARWAVFVLRFPKTAIVVLLVAVGFALDFTIGTLGINTDTADMISPELPWRRHFIEYRQAFSVRDRNLVIVIDAESAELAEDFAAELAAELRVRPQLYQSVFLAGEGEFFARNGLLYLSIPELEQLADRLASAQPLLGLMKRSFNGAAVVDVVEQSLNPAQEQTPDRADPAPDQSTDQAVDNAAATDRPELEALYAELAEALDAAREGGRDPLAWRELITGGDTGSTRRLVLVQPVLDFNRLQPARDALEDIRATAQQLAERYPNPVTTRLTGSVAMEHEELVSVSQGAGLAGVAALLLVALVLYATLRSWLLLAISLVTLVAGLILTAAFAAAAVGHLNLLSVAFAVLYVGLGVDFVLHVCLRLKELLAEGSALEAAIVGTMRGVGSSLVICAITTAAGFYSFIPTPFEGVRELGLISGTGMFISLLMSVTLLPALIATLLRARRLRERRPWVGPGLLAPLTRRPRAVVAATVVVVLATFALLPRVYFDNNPTHLRDPDTESVTTLLDLAAESEAPTLNLVAVAPDNATARRWAAELEALPTVASVETVDAFVPDEQAEKQFLLEDMSLILGPDFAALERAPPNARMLVESLEDLRRALRQARSDAARELLRAVDALLDRLPTLPERDRALTLLALDRDLTSDLPSELERLEVGLQARPFERGDLPPELADRWLADDGRELIEIVPAENVNDNDAAARFVTSVRERVPQATGLPVVYREASVTVIRAFQLALLYSFLMVSLILWVFLRRLQDALLVIAPVLLAAGVTAGATVLLDLPLNFANIIALPLLVGVGVDNGIHIVHRMRTEPPGSGDAFSTSTSRAVLASGLTTVASFGNLAFSAHLGTASMGKLLTLGMAATLAATLILLPALLRLRGERAHVQ